MPNPVTRWRVSPPLGPGEVWSAIEFKVGGPGTTVSRVKFAQDGRAQATRWVAQHNSDIDLRTKVGGNVLRDLLKSEAHRNVKQ